jgi:predicted aspartyl protease
VAGQGTVAWRMALAVGVLAACAEVERAERIEMAGDTPSTAVSLELAGPGGAAVVVPVHVNGSDPHVFVLDTGATMTCIDAGLADRLGLPEAQGQLGVGMGIGQDAAVLRLVAADSLRVGGATAVDLTLCALDLEQFRAIGLDVDGLLGLNFLREFRLVVDFQAELLSLER